MLHVQVDLSIMEVRKTNSLVVQFIEIHNMLKFFIKPPNVIVEAPINFI